MPKKEVKETERFDAFDEADNRYTIVKNMEVVHQKGPGGKIDTHELRSYYSTVEGHKVNKINDTEYEIVNLSVRVKVE